MTIVDVDYLLWCESTCAQQSCPKWYFPLSPFSTTFFRCLSLSYRAPCVCVCEANVLRYLSLSSFLSVWWLHSIDFSFLVSSSGYRLAAAAGCCCCWDKACICEIGMMTRKMIQWHRMVRVRDYDECRTFSLYSFLFLIQSWCVIGRFSLFLPSITSSCLSNILLFSLLPLFCILGSFARWHR